MGRVFDAIKKASAADKNGAPKRQQPTSERRGESPSIPGLPSAKQIEEQLFSGSSILSVSHETAQSSASTAHTADVPGGSALPGGIASRDAGATLGAAGAARVGDLPFMTFPPRASSLTLSRLVSLVLPTVNNFARCAREFCKLANAWRCVRLLLPVPASERARP